MEMNLSTGYGQVMELVNQLSDREIEQLVRQIQCKFENRDRSCVPMQELILQAPTWTDEEYNNYLEARDHINQSRLK